MKKILLVILLIFFSCATNKNSKKDISQKPLKLSPSNGIYTSFDGKTKYEEITLENGLRVYLVQDDRFVKTTSQMTVLSGSSSDPQNMRGMSHFIEHMLFIATQKYPQIDGFMDFISKKGGYTNAMTTSDFTSYYFNIQNDFLDEALDRFSQFFIAPKFFPEYVEKEKNAVNSEYINTKETDGRKITNFIRSNILTNDSGISGFSVGNLESMKDIDFNDLVDFHKKHYSSNIMVFTMASNMPLEKQKEYAIRYFKDVKNSDAKVNKTKGYNSINREMFSKIITFKTKDDNDFLNIYFPISIDSKEYKENAKYYDLMGHILGYEGQGSLYSYLKQKDYITELSSGVDSLLTDYIKSFSLSLGLTKKGLANTQDILDIIFSTINDLQENGLKQYTLDEINNMDYINKLYPKSFQSNDDIAYNISMASVYRNNLDEILNGSLIGKLDNKKVKKYLSDFNLKNALIFKGSVDQADKSKYKTFDNGYYSIDYKIENAIENAKTKIEEITYPNPNKFIPKDLNLINGTDNEFKNIIDFGQFYFAQDDKFNKPISSIRIDFKNPDMDDKFYTKKVLLTELIKESVNQWGYDARISGINYSINPNEYGISLSVDGFSNTLEFTLDLVKRLKNASISQKDFDNIKKDYTNRVKNLENLKVFEKLFRLSQYTMGSRSALSDEEMIFDYENLTLKDIDKFSKDLFSNVSLSGLGYGNLKTSDIKDMLYKIKDEIGINYNGKFENKTTAKFDTDTVLNLSVDGKDLDSVGYIRILENKDTSIKQYVISSIFSSIYNQQIFADLRTKKSIGYVVGMISNSSKNHNQILIYTQSQKYSIKEIEDMFDEWIDNSKNSVENITKEQFEAVKNSYLLTLEKPQNSINELMAYKYNDIFKYNSHKIDDIIKELKNLTFQDYQSGALSIFNTHDNFTLNLKGYKKDQALPDEDKKYQDIKSVKEKTNYI